MLDHQSYSYMIFSSTKAGMHIYARASAKGKRVQVSVTSTPVKKYSIPFMSNVVPFIPMQLLNLK